jgi:hypothetical protein
MSVEEVVEYKIVKMIRDHLERDLITNIPPDDPARPDDVTIGKHTDSPYGIHLIVHADHPLGFTGDKLESSAERKGSRAERYHPGEFPAESIGGWKWRRIFGTVEIKSVQKDTTPAEAVAILALVKVRIAHCITRDVDLTRLTDNYGYQVVAIEMSEVYGYASGGGRTSVDRHWCDWTATAAYPRGYTGA